FRHARQTLISHLYDALGQDRLRRERLGCLREVAAKTLQERPSLIERIADRVCLAKRKRQRIFSHAANSSPEILRCESGGTLKRGGRRATVEWSTINGLRK